MLRIAVVRRIAGFGIGGAEGYVAHCAYELMKQGHDVTIIADSSYVHGVNFIRAPVYGRGSILKNLSFFLSVKRVISSAHFDFVYACSRVAPSHFVRISDPIHVLWLKQRYGNLLDKIVRYTPRHALLLWLERVSLNQAKLGIITNSFHSRKWLERFYNPLPCGIFSIYNGIDFSRFNPGVHRYRNEIRRQLNISKNKRVLLFVGADWKRKGLDILIKAVNVLDDDVILIVAGGRKRTDEKRVRFLGQVRDVERLYGASDVLVLPTHYDPFSNVVAEALACGIPVITSKWNGASEIIQEGKTGIVVDLKVEDLCKAISTVLNIPPDPEECYNSVKCFSWENHIKKLIRLYLKS